MKLNESSCRRHWSESHGSSKSAVDYWRRYSNAVPHVMMTIIRLPVELQARRRVYVNLDKRTVAWSACRADELDAWYDARYHVTQSTIELAIFEYANVNLLYSFWFHVYVLHSYMVRYIPVARKFPNISTLFIKNTLSLFTCLYIETSILICLMIAPPAALLLTHAEIRCTSAAHLHIYREFKGPSASTLTMTERHTGRPI
jgi:hypothetical protein